MVTSALKPTDTASCIRGSLVYWWNPTPVQLLIVVVFDSFPTPPEIFQIRCSFSRSHQGWFHPMVKPREQMKWQETQDDTSNLLDNKRKHIFDVKLTYKKHEAKHSSTLSMFKPKNYGTTEAFTKARSIGTAKVETSVSRFSYDVKRRVQNLDTHPLLEATDHANQLDDDTNLTLVDPCLTNWYTPYLSKYIQITLPMSIVTEKNANYRHYCHCNEGNCQY